MSSQKVDIAIQSAASQQPHKLPIPRLQQQNAAAGSLLSTSKPNEMLMATTWPTTATQIPLTPLSVIPCQQSLTANPPGKPVPNKRGRKPLTTMPSTKKHIQNLTNQRAFRQRREQYIRGLEQKASMYEVLYIQAAEEVKALKEQLAAFTKQRLDGGDGNVCGTGLSADQINAELATKLCGDKVADVGNTMFFNQQQQQQSKDGTNGDVMMSDAVSQASVSSDGSSSISSQLYQFSGQCLSPPSPSGAYSPVNDGAYLSAFSSPTHANFTFDDTQPKQLQAESLNQTSLQSAGGFIVDSMFCETKSGELCYCDPAGPTNKWIIPKNLVPAPYATPDPSQGYFTQTNVPAALPSPEEPDQQWQVEQAYYEQQQPITPPSTTTTFPSSISNATGHSNGATQDLKWVNSNGSQDIQSPGSA